MVRPRLLGSFLARHQAVFRGFVEWRRGAPCVGRSASDVSALSSYVAKSRQTLHTFPPPPLKFRTAGFPQYGFKLDVSHGDLRRRVVRPLAQDTHLHRITTDLYAITRPPQAPLWSFRTR